MSTSPSLRPRALPLPTSAELLGFLAKTLELKLDLGRRERTWRNYIAGRPVKAETRKALLDAWVRALLAPAEAPLFDERHHAAREEAIGMLRALLAAHTEHWDDLVASLPSGAIPRTAPALAIVALRLALIDLCLRIAGLLASLGLLHEGWTPPPEQLAPWAKENPIGDTLRQLLTKLGLTRDALAEALDVSKQAVDKWLDGVDVPPASRLDELAELAKKKLGEEKADTLRHLLRASRLLAKLSRNLEACIGREELEQLGRALYRLTWSALFCVGRPHLVSEEVRASALEELVTFGSASDLGRRLLRDMAEREEDPTWAGALDAAAMDWLQTLGRIQATILNWERGQQLATELGLHHLDLEEQPKLMLLLQLAPSKHLPEFVAQLRESSPKRGTLELLAVNVMEFERLCELQDEPEKLLGFAKLGETCQLLAAMGPWCSEEFNRMAWVCHLRRLGELLKQARQALERRSLPAAQEAHRVLLAASKEVPRMPPPEDLARHVEECRVDIQELLEVQPLVFKLLESLEQGTRQ